MHDNNVIFEQPETTCKLISEGLDKLLKLSAHKLTPVEEKIVVFYNVNPTALKLSSTQLSERIGIHSSSLVRFIQKLGFDSFREFRHFLKDLSNEKPSSFMRHQNTIDIAKQGVAKSTIDQEIMHLQLLDEKKLELFASQTCHAITSARQVFVYGHQQIQPNATQLVRRLKRSGILCGELPPSSERLAEELTSAQQNDTLILLFTHGMNNKIQSLRKISALLELQLVVVTDFKLNTEKWPKNLIHYQYYRGDKGSTRSVTPLPLINNVLIRSLTVHDKYRVKQGLERFDQLNMLLESK